MLTEEPSVTLLSCLHITMGTPSARAAINAGGIPFVSTVTTYSGFLSAKHVAMISPIIEQIPGE